MCVTQTPFRAEIRQCMSKHNAECHIQRHIGHMQRRKYQHATPKFTYNAKFDMQRRVTFRQCMLTYNAEILVTCNAECPFTTPKHIQRRNAVNVNMQRRNIILSQLAEN